MAWVELSMRNTIIVPLVREGTRNHLQMAPVQTQPPLAPAPLFFLPPTSLHLSLCQMGVFPRWESRYQLHPCLCPVLAAGHSEEQVPRVPSSLCPSHKGKYFSPCFAAASPRARGWLHSALSAFLPSPGERVSCRG